MPNEKTVVAKIPRIHKSSKAQQDFIEEKMLKAIRECTNPTRKKWLMWDLECWIQNGRPVFGKIRDKFTRGPYGDKENVHSHNTPSQRSAMDDMLKEKRKRNII